MSLGPALQTKIGVAEWEYEYVSKMWRQSPRFAIARLSSDLDSVSVSLTFRIQNHLPIQQRPKIPPQYSDNDLAKAIIELVRTLPEDAFQQWSDRSKTEGSIVGAILRWFTRQ